MKKYLKITSFLVVFVLALTALCSCKDKPEAPDGYKLVSDLDYVDYYLFVPNSWVLDDSSAMTCAYVSDEDRTSVSVIQRNRVSSESDSLDVWYNDYYIPSLKDDLGGSIVEKSSEDIKLDGVDAKKHYIDITINGATYNFIVIVAYTNASFYCVTYTSMGELFEKNLETFNTILTEFKFD